MFLWYRNNINGEETEIKLQKEVKLKYEWYFIIFHENSSFDKMHLTLVEKRILKTVSMDYKFPCVSVIYISIINTNKYYSRYDFYHFQ